MAIYQALGELLQDGLPLFDAISFLEIMWPKHQPAFHTCKLHLQAGHTFSKSLQLIGFPSTHLGRLALAQEGSYLTDALLQCAEEEKTTAKYEKEFKNVLIYPILLLLAVISLLFVIRGVLLPQMKILVPPETLKNNYFIRFVFFFIQFLPQIILLHFIILCLVTLLFNIWKEKNSALHVLHYLSFVPVLKHLLKDYITWHFTLEVGRLMEQGLSFIKILDLLQQANVPGYIREMATIIANESRQGYTLPQIIQQFPFMRAETASIIQQGEQINQQSRKMLLFSQQSQQYFLSRLKHIIQWIQPILFAFVALIIVSVYLILLLPMLTSFNATF